jgi:hypothetical protein
MNLRKVIGFSSLLLFFLVSHAQNVLMLDVYKPWGGMKRIHYYPKDEIGLKIKELRHTFRGRILIIHDSSIVIVGREGIDSISIKQIRMIVTDRSNWLTRAFSSFFRTAGVGVIILDTFNNVINNESQLIKPRIVITGASLFAAGMILKLYGTKRYRIGKNKILRIINTSPK